MNDKTHHLPTLVDLGVPLTQAENRIPFELKMYRKGMSYEESLGEIPDPAPPVAMAWCTVYEHLKPYSFEMCVTSLQ